MAPGWPLDGGNWNWMNGEGGSYKVCPVEKIEKVEKINFIFDLICIVISSCAVGKILGLACGGGWIWDLEKCANCKWYSFERDNLLTK